MTRNRLLVVTALVGLAIAVITVRAPSGGESQPPTVAEAPRHAHAPRPMVVAPTEPPPLVAPVPPLKPNDTKGRMPEAFVQERAEALGLRFDALFGKDFPADKREQAKAAQRRWLEGHHAALDSFDNHEVTKVELTTRVHGNLLAYAKDMEAILSPAQYELFMAVKPGVDPFPVWAPDGVNPPDPH